MDTLVALVNGFGSEPRRLADEQALPYPSPSEVLKGLELPRSLRSAIGERSLCRLADALYPVFAADATSDRVRLVNDLLTRSRLRPAVETRADRIQGVWVVGHDRDMLLAAAAVGLREQLTAHDPDRLGTCAGERCGDAYVDTSPGGHRRYCSITCQNRNRVAAFRRRKAGPKSVARRPTEG
jgi:predicted RNA-binding Zn ribbon-like protein